jgi:hypothetical protein
VTTWQDRRRGPGLVPEDRRRLRAFKPRRSHVARAIIDHRDHPRRRGEPADAPEWLARPGQHQSRAEWLEEIHENHDDKGVLDKLPDGSVVVWQRATSYGNRAQLRPEPTSPTLFHHAQGCDSDDCSHIDLYWMSKELTRVVPRNKDYTISNKPATRQSDDGGSKELKPETFAVAPLPKPVLGGVDVIDVEAKEVNTAMDDVAQSSLPTPVEVSKRAQHDVKPVRRAPPVGNVLVRIRQPKEFRLVMGGDLLMVSGFDRESLELASATARELGFGKSSSPAPAVESETSPRSKTKTAFDAKVAIKVLRVIHAILKVGRGDPAPRLGVLCHLIPNWDELDEKDQLRADRRLSHVIASQSNEDGAMRTELAKYGAARIEVIKQGDARCSGYQLFDASDKPLQVTNKELEGEWSHD